MNLLFVKDDLSWPRTSGHDVHGYEMMRALGARGHRITLLTAKNVSTAALEGLSLVGHRQLTHVAAPARSAVLTPLQQRFVRYWGIPTARIAAVAQVAADSSADAVIAIGLDALPYVSSVSGATRVWYAADEWVRHHLSLVSLLDKETWSHIKTAAIKGLYERAFAATTDRVWVVSPEERRAVSWVMGGKLDVDVIPNGVDAEYFKPAPTGGRRESSAVFWGRLDFEPNIDALRWFTGQVWPTVLQHRPEATLQILGARPSSRVMALTQMRGVQLAADLPDLRSAISQHQVTVLPFVSGGGIKNKLLEAAALGMPIVASLTACQGLEANAPIIQAGTAGQWVDALLSLWASREKRAETGERLRHWVVEQHSWATTAARAEAALLRRYEEKGK